ncbi:MAG: lipoprotein signal peptidase [Bacteroidetes bacterium]|nr:lipoprotein signal peptidase [Bacteroidota bacterium]
MKKALLIIIPVLLIDQVLKIWIKTHMHLGEEYHIIGNWFIIHFTENNGMAFGMEFAGRTGKLTLTIFRIFAIGVLGWYLNSLIKKNVKFSLILSISLILTGALGNIIDSVFYGELFSASNYFQTATFLPEGGGYSGIMYGKVVDMFYFPIITTHYPNWFPFVGGNDFIFFRPVFNIADSAITIAIFILIFFHRDLFKKDSHKTEVLREDNQAENI